MIPQAQQTQQEDPTATLTIFLMPQPEDNVSLVATLALHEQINDHKKMVISSHKQPICTTTSKEGSSIRNSNGDIED